MGSSSNGSCQGGGARDIPRNEIIHRHHCHSRHKYMPSDKAPTSRIHWSETQHLGEPHAKNYRKYSSIYRIPNLVLIFLILLLPSPSYSFEKSFGRMGLGQEDTFQPNFQSNFRGNNPSTSFTDLEKDYESELEKINRGTFPSKYTNHLAEEYHSNGDISYPDTSEFPFDKDYPESYPGYYSESRGSKQKFETPGHNRQRKHKSHYDEGSSDINTYGQEFYSSPEFGYGAELGGEELHVDESKQPVNGLEHSEYICYLPLGEIHLLNYNIIIPIV